MIGDWWSLLIVRDAFLGKRRFGEFQRSLGVARNILTARLQKLVERGVLGRAPASDGSAYREYVLTEKGRGLFPVLAALGKWGARSSFESGELDFVLVDRERGGPVSLELRAKDGRVLGPNDVRIVPAPARRTRPSPVTPPRRRRKAPSP